MPRVWKKGQQGIPADAVYIGRPTKWGNPFIIGRDGTRAEVCAKHADYLDRNHSLRMDAIRELHDKDLVCFCAPLQCHGDTLLRIANE